MIRPLTEEDQLQTLEQRELSTLRSEFVDQVMTLRRKVLNRVKPKLMNGKRINGSMLAGLVQSYINSINSGIVPNIQSAWQYICQNECQKALEKSLKQFDSDMVETFSIKAPMYEEELREVYKEAKKYATSQFREAMIGEDAEEYINELKDKFKQKFDQLKIENERAASTKAQAFL